MANGGRRALRLWVLFGALSLAAAVGFAQTMTNPAVDRSVFLPGKTTSGHYQIELACSACHTEEFGDTEDFQSACVGCHGAELERVEDSHPERKFTDPRNADRIEQLDARYCVTCHSEHEPERTETMGLSLPGDYCYHCHEDVAEERPSHEGLAFDSCASAGCHNFHDNQALYEDFLVRHGAEPDVLLQPIVERPAIEGCPSQARRTRLSLNAAKDGPWRESAAPEALEECTTCHGVEVEGWLGGKHGMRPALGLSAMKVGDARLPMKAAASHRTLDCAACHGGKGPAPGKALSASQRNRLEVESCLGCHDDEHSRSYKGSRHHELWLADMKQEVARGAGVSCATCHLPRMETEDGDLFVQHNQNAVLRPNEKMVRTSCGHCHGLSLTLDALADPQLILENFTRAPDTHIESVDWAMARE